MFTGIKSTGNSAPIRCFLDAQRNLEAASKTPTGRARRPDYRGGFPLGAHYKSVTTIREGNNGEIILRLYDTDVVTWYSDDSFEVNSWASKTTGEFVERFTPAGIYAHFAGRNGADPYISFRMAGESWRDAKVCHGDAVFRPVDGGWAPDESTLQAFHWVEFDPKLTRAISREHNLADFTNWLSMAPRHLSPPLEHRKVDPHFCAELLKDRDFKSAAIHLPLIDIPNGFGLRDRMRPLPIATPSWDRIITMASVARLRLFLYDQGEAGTERAEKVMTWAQYEDRKRRARALEAAGGQYARGWRYVG